MAAKMLISVIIPHLNQLTYLEKGLKALQAQIGVRRDVQIIVVDNGSRKLPEAICEAWPNVTLTTEPTPGPGPARNKGVKLAEGDLLAFIDADCTAAPNWLSAIETAFDDPDTQVIGGDVRVRYETPGKPTFLEPYESIYSYRNHEYIAKEGYSGTGNLAMRPDVHTIVGDFAGIDVAEDRDWGIRAKAHGITTKFVTEMVIYHPARDSVGELQQKWDRHIAHDFAQVETKGDAGKWLIKSFAMAASPLAEIPTVLTSDRVSGAKERWLAFLCLARVRLYRSQKMFSVLKSGAGKDISGAWNRR